jgi:transcriptional regulator with XRE-family HTH domain
MKQGELNDMTGEELQRWRIKAGMTQQALADALGVHRVTVAKWETGALAIPRYLPLAIEGLKHRRKK